MAAGCGGGSQEDAANSPATVTTPEGVTLLSGAGGLRGVVGVEGVRAAEKPPSEKEAERRQAGKKICSFANSLVCAMGVQGALCDHTLDDIRDCVCGSAADAAITGGLALATAVSNCRPLGKTAFQFVANELMPSGETSTSTSSSNVPFDGSKTPLITLANKAGEYLIRNVLPGDYAVVGATVADGKVLKAAATVKVAAGNVVDIGILTMQRTGYITGTILKESETDHSGIQVSVLGIGSQGTTARNGTVTIQAVPPGSWDVEARFEDVGLGKCFKTHTSPQKVAVRSGEETPLGTRTLSKTDCKAAADSGGTGASSNSSSTATSSTTGTTSVSTTGGPASTTTSTDTTAPTVTLTKTPPVETTASSATFEFASNEPGATFECQLDSGGYTACISPKTCSGLSGDDSKGHRFDVRATDATGNKSAPVSHAWTVDLTPPNFLGLASATASGSTAVSLSWSPATDPLTPANEITYEICIATGSTFCLASFLATAPSVVGATSSTITGLAAGTHYVLVRAKDKFGNRDTNTMQKSVTLGSGSQSCGPSNCSSGCCSGNTCIPSESMTPQACGSGGNACATCDTNFVCSSQACSLDGTSLWKLQVQSVEFYDSGSEWDSSSSPGDPYVEIVFYPTSLTGSCGTGQECSSTKWDPPVSGGISAATWAPDETVRANIPASTLTSTGFAIGVFDDDDGWTAPETIGASSYFTLAGAPFSGGGQCFNWGSFDRVKSLFLCVKPQ